MTETVIIKADTTGDLTEAVNVAIRCGDWRVNGSPFVFRGWVCQQLIREVTR